MGREDQIQRWMQQSRRLRVGDCRVDLSLNEVQRGDATIRLTPKAAGVLEVLLFIAGQPASKERLLAEVWRGEFPTDDVVTHAIGELRRAFGDDPRTAAYIRTIPRVGYALVAEVDARDEALRLDVPGAPAAVPASAAPGEQEDDRSPSGTVVHDSTRSRSRWRPAVAVSAALLVILAVVLAWRGLQPDLRTANAVATRAAVAVPDPASLDVLPVTYLPGQESMPALSPDGSLLAFSAQPDPEQPRRIYLQPIEGGTPRPISDVDVIWEGAPVFSPDGTQLLFQRFNGDACQFVIASTLGGQERVMGDCMDKMLVHVDWTPDGKGLLLPVGRIQFDRGSVLSIMDTATGEVTAIDYPAGSSGDVQGRYSPDGRRIAFRRGAIPFSDLFVMNADGSELRQLTHFSSQMMGFDWLPDGSALVFSSDHGGENRLWRVQLEDGAISDLGVGQGAWPDVARLRGTLVFVRAEYAADIVEATLDQRAETAPPALVQTSRGDWVPSYSPDGSQFAFVSSRTGLAGVYVQQGDVARQVAEYGQSEAGLAGWSADGSQLAYVVGGGRPRLMITDVASARSRELTPPDLDVAAPVFSPDGEWVVFTGRPYTERRDTVWNLWRMRLDGSDLEQLTTDGGAGPQFIDADTVIYMATIVGGEWRRLRLSDRHSEALDISGLTFWNRAAWVARPEALYALLSEEPVGIYRRAWADGAEWTLLEPLDEVNVAYNQFSLSPDGRHMLYSFSREQAGDIYKVSGLR